MIHLHARLEDGSTTSDVSAYTHLRNTIREAGCDALLSFSAGDDGGRASHDQRLAIPEAGGDFSSLSGGSFNIGDRQYDNPPSYLREMAIRLRQSGVMPEIEIFDSGQLHGIHALINEGMIDPPFCIQFVFGVPGGMPIDERLLPILIENLPAGAHWMVSCQTSDPLVHARFMREAAAAGGHLRTGIEDIVFVAPGDYACSNVALVEQCTGYALSAGRSVATSEEARRKVGKPAMPTIRRVSS